ncbi:MAG TPA: translation initiation factor IF-2 [Candidatus Omnitrophota bacterium]|nr:translation initiation factor IF-2 [Candidatus Omnitrophota bacterium]HPS19871.1 translation initiation factor IF-2 [Candidatus Omnitrophota bacterium]
MSIKVSELALELGVKCDDLMESLRKLYVEVEDESSSVDEKIAALMRVKMGVAKPKKEKKKSSKSEKATPETATESGEEGAAVKPAKTRAKKTKKTQVESEGIESQDENTAALSEAHQEVHASAETADIAEKEKSEEKIDHVSDTGKTLPPKPRGVIVVKRASEEEKKATKDAVQSGVLPPAAAKEQPGKIVAGPELLKETHEKDVDAKRFGESTYKKDKIHKIDRFEGKKIIKTMMDDQHPYERRFKKHTKIVKAEKKVEIASEVIKPYDGADFKIMQLQIPSSIRAIAVKAEKRPNDLIQYMMRRGMLVNINQDLDEKTTRDLLKDLGYELEIPKTIEEDLMAEHHEEEDIEASEKRAPVVTFMGHVDHGKTSLLDYIRNTMVAKKEKGGITQHIGAYRVETPKGAVTFLDTPGHEAFTSMRARGANVTDVVVLVVAADDGVMPQTKEAIDHANAANVPIVVAINKCDVPGAKPERVRIELQQLGLAPEAYGGKTVMVEVSAKTGEGVDDLVDMLMLESELLELKANPALRARGVVLESRKTSEHGVVASVLVQNGTLHLGDVILAGIYYGKVKALINDRGDRVEKVLPSMPVEVLGLQGVPEAGDDFFVVKDEKKAKTLSELKQSEQRRKHMVGSQRITLEDFHAMVEDGAAKELRIILKADVQGSTEALVRSLDILSNNEVKIIFAHTMVGDINESDVMLAVVSNAVIIGFNVKIDPKAADVAKSENIEIKVYGIIYEAVNDVKAALEGLLEPIENEVMQGIVQIKQVFTSKNSKAAGCIVAKGTIHRKDKVRIKRAGEVIYTGNISNLRRFKDDVRDVKEGMECGITIDGFNNIAPGDVMEFYVIEKVARRLDSRN